MTERKERFLAEMKALDERGNNLLAPPKQTILFDNTAKLRQEFEKFSVEQNKFNIAQDKINNVILKYLLSQTG
jgi:hypothetical protein